jgi:hypothetical protein
MPIPTLNEHGFLPLGTYDCTFAEIEAEFGQNRWVQDNESASRREVLKPHRGRLCQHLMDYLTELHRVGLGVEVIINGSFVTGKPDPNDIDLIVVFPSDHDFSRPLPPREYNLLSKRRLRDAGYPFDIFVVAAGGTAYKKALRLYQQVRGRDDLEKGLLRVRP